MDPWADYLSRRQSRLQREDASERATAPTASTYGTWLGPRASQLGPMLNGGAACPGGRTFPGASSSSEQAAGAPWMTQSSSSTGMTQGGPKPPVLATAPTFGPPSGPGNPHPLPDYPFNVPNSSPHGIRKFYDSAGAYRTNV